MIHPSKEEPLYEDIVEFHVFLIDDTDEKLTDNSSFIQNLVEGGHENYVVKLMVKLIYDGENKENKENKEYKENKNSLF